MSPGRLRITYDGIYNETFVGTLTCSYLGGPDNMVQWLRGDSILENKTDKTLSVEGVVTGEKFTCRVTNMAGSDSTVRIIRPIVTSHPSDARANVNESVTFCCNITSYPPPIYQWQKVMGSLPASVKNSNNSCLVVSHVKFGDEGQYFCRGTSNNTHSSSRKALLTSEFC